MQECMLSDALNFEPLNDFVQILNCTRNHWSGICISTVGCQPGKVNMFDSMCTGDIPLSTKEAVASLLCTTKRFISLVFPDVQQQPNHYDCGLFALAYASSVCNNLDPATINYDQHCLRPHFLKCLKNGEFKSFPCEPKPLNPRPPLRNSFCVYCFCRLPDRGDDSGLM